MENAVTTIPRAPSTTLSVDAQLYLGRNQIRRNIGRSTSLYICKSVVDRIITLTPGESLSISAGNSDVDVFDGSSENGNIDAFDDPIPVLPRIQALSIVTSSPIEVALGYGVTRLSIKKYLFLDSATTEVTLTNDPTATVDAVINLAYAY